MSAAAVEHFAELARRRSEFQRHTRIVSAVHRRLDGDGCLEVVLLRGKASELKGIGQALIAHRGAKHGRLLPAISSQAL